MADGKTPIEYAISFLMDRIPVPQLPSAVQAIAPVLLDFAQNEVILTDDRRAELQTHILRALREAGLEGVDVG